MTKDLPGGYYLVLKRESVVPRYRTIISIGYKYNVCKILYSIATEGVGVKKSVIHYLYK